MFRRIWSIATATAIFAAVWADGYGSNANAETTITGSVDDVRLEVSEATVDDLLAGLRVKFGLDYRTAVPLDERVGGVYTGSISRVVKALIRNYDYVLKTSADHTSVLITDHSRSAAQAGLVPSPAPPPAAAATQLNTHQQALKNTSTITTHLQAQVAPFANLRQTDAPRLQGASVGPTPVPTSLSPPSSGASASTIAALTRQAQSTLTGLTTALARISPR